MPVTKRFGDESDQDGQRSKGVAWIDVDLDNPDDRVWLEHWEEIGSPTRALLLDPVGLQRRKQLDDGLFLGLQTPRSEDLEQLDQLTDFKLLIGKARVVTVHAGPIAAVDELQWCSRAGGSLTTPVDLLGFMIAAATSRIERLIFDIARATDAAEDRLLDESAPPSARDLNLLRRSILRVRRQLKSVQQLLAQVSTDPALVLDGDDRQTLLRSSEHLRLYIESLEDFRARIELLQENVDAQRAATMAQTSLDLTIVATVFLPLTFISGLLGMNVAGIPDEHNPWAFWIVSGALVVIALVVWVLLRRRMRL
jgi:zinc transporter